MTSKFQEQLSAKDVQIALILKQNADIMVALTKMEQAEEVAAAADEAMKKTPTQIAGHGSNASIAIAPTIMAIGATNSQQTRARGQVTGS